MCSPCLINYDYVGKLETFNEDIIHILTDAYHMNSSHAHYFVSVNNENQEGRANSFRTEKYLNQLSSNDLEKLKQHYVIDIDLFQYHTSSSALKLDTGLFYELTSFNNLLTNLITVCKLVGT